MIYDIFSNEKIIESNKKEIIEIDYREKKSLVPSKLSKYFYLEFKELKIGDYIVKDTIIERKSMHDFVESIKNNRLKKQIKEIKQYKNYLLIIEGNLKRISGIHPNAAKGFIISTLINNKVPILFTEDEEETARYLFLIGNQQKKENKINPTKKIPSKKDRQLFVLQSFPGIGSKKSKELLEEFKTLKKVFNSDSDKLKKILGKKAKDFTNILN